MKLPDELFHFDNPPPEWRSMPLWAWNGLLEPDRIKEALADFKSAGVGGVIMHPRPGLITEYLSEDYFAAVHCAVEEAERLGIGCHLYDENSYPAGFAGGHVPSRLPHATAQSLRASLIHEPVNMNETERLFACLPVDSHDTGHNGTALHLLLQWDCPPHTPWTADFAMVDLTRPEVAREFIETTYSAYRRHVGEHFGKTVRYAFCDEPHLITHTIHGATPHLPYSSFIEREFRQEHGYVLRDQISGLFVETAYSSAVRRDYYRTLQRLFTGNFLAPLRAWCEREKLQLTGHFFEHLWPYPVFVPDVMDANAYLHVPGIDMLACFHDFDEWTRNRHVLLTIREAASVARQTGSARVLCEAHGVGGNGATLDQIKAAGDWLLVHGINLISEHLSFYSSAGARKYDHPQTFSPHSPWWADYRSLADHHARLAYCMGQGASPRHWLVLQPTTTGWIQHSPLSVQRGDTPNGFPQTHAACALLESQGELVQLLCDHQIDFDLGSELLIERLGRVDAHGFHVGAASYQGIVIPRGMLNLEPATCRLLEQWMKQGGCAYSEGDAPTMVAGRIDPRPASWSQAGFPGWRSFNDRITLVRTMVEDGAQASFLTGSDRELIGHQCRHLSDGSQIHLVVNSDRVRRRIHFRTSPGAVTQLNSMTGTHLPVRTRSMGGMLEAELELSEWGHALICVQPEPACTIAEQSFPAPQKVEAGCSEWGTGEHPVALRPLTTAPLSSNVLMLDYCDLELGAQRHTGLNVRRASSLLWQHFGFDADPWDRAIQFRSNTVRRIVAAAPSPYAIHYHFESGLHGQVDPVFLTVEHPHSFAVSFNGHSIDFGREHHWLDRDLLCARVDPYLRHGGNHVELRANALDRHTAIERIYVIGTFAVEPMASGFRVQNQRSAQLGDWVTQGFPFMVAGMRYPFEFVTDVAGIGIRVEVPNWEGSVLRVRLDGDVIGMIAWPPYELKVSRLLPPGLHHLELEVVGNLRNLWGPHFLDRSAEKHASPHAWDHFPPNRPPGSSYTLQSQGLLSPPRVHVDLGAHPHAIVREGDHIACTFHAEQSLG